MSHLSPFVVVRRSRRDGFTLVELLVVIAVIALVISLLLPGISRCRHAVRKTRELNTGRQVLTAVMLYANDAKGEVLPGYAKRDWVNGAMVVRNAAGDRLTGEVAQRYPWRLATYLNDDFRGLYENVNVLGEIRVHEPEYSGFGVDADYVLSLFPSLGMNVNFFGGNDRVGAFEPSFQRVFGRIHASKLDSITRPSEVVLFTSARTEPQPGVPIIGNTEGFFRIEPPIFTAARGRQWEPAYDERSSAPGLNSGFVSLRWGGKAVSAFPDGHAAVLGWEELGDMRRWADAASSANWGLVPRS